jgi:hypothetical protein
LRDLGTGECDQRVTLQCFHGHCATMDNTVLNGLVVKAVNLAQVFNYFQFISRRFDCPKPIYRPPNLNAWILRASAS